MITEEALLGLKKKVDTAKTNAAQKQGQQQATLQRLNDEYGCKTVDVARTEINNLDTQLAEIDIEIEQGVQKLKTDFNLTDNDLDLNR